MGYLYDGHINRRCNVIRLCMIAMNMYLSPLGGKRTIAIFGVRLFPTILKINKFYWEGKHIVGLLRIYS